MDNRQISLTSNSPLHLANALEIMWGASKDTPRCSHIKVAKLRNATRYYGNPTTTSHAEDWEQAEEGTPTLILLSTKSHRDCTPLLFKHDLEQTLVLVNGWLKENPPQKKPDIDGDCEPAWKAFTDSWGHVCGYDQVILAIQPAWAMYGK